MKTLLTVITAILILSSCNGLGRDSDDPGYGAGNDTMTMNTHGLNGMEDPNPEINRTTLDSTVADSVMPQPIVEEPEY